MKAKYIQLHEQNNSIIGAVEFKRNNFNLHKVKEALESHFDAEINITNIEMDKQNLTVKIYVDISGDIETYQDVIFGSETWLYL